MLFVASAPAWATTSYYRTGTLAAATTYDSVQRNDWTANSLTNTAGVNITARAWSYNVTTSTYIFQSGDTLLAPNQAVGQGFSYPSSQSAKNYCRRVSGGAATSGHCSGVY